jgi:Ca-activated chloride channel family protein
VAEHLGEETINRVLLLSDGLANKGITSHSELGKHAAEINRRGIATSNFGVGLDFNEHLLELMSNQGGGNFYYIEAPNQIQEIFLQELEELLHVSVKDVELVLSLPDRGSSFEILGGWQHAVEENTVNIHIGDLAENQERSVYLIATIPDSDQLASIPLTINLTALDENGAAIRQTVEVTFSFATLAECEAAPYDKELMERYSRVHLSDTTREALLLERQGKNKQASQLLSKAIHETSAFMPMAAMEEFKERSEKMERGLSERARKRMHYNTYRDSRTRDRDDELKED